MEFLSIITKATNLEDTNTIKNILFIDVNVALEWED